LVRHTEDEKRSLQYVQKLEEHREALKNVSYMDDSVTRILTSD
jgi:hypothetical protein